MPINAKNTDLINAQNILEYTQVPTVCVSRQTLPQLLSMLSNDYLKSLKTIICFDYLSPDEILMVPQNLEVFLYQDFLEDKEDSETDLYISIEQSYKKNLPNKETIVLVMHTSGTTNEPKGAMLTHGNVLSGYSHNDFLGYNFNEGDFYLSYVPLSHIQEQLLLAVSMIFGFRIGFMTNLKPQESIENVRK